MVVASIQSLLLTLKQRQEPARNRARMLAFSDGSSSYSVPSPGVETEAKTSQKTRAYARFRRWWLLVCQYRYRKKEHVGAPFAPALSSSLSYLVVADMSELVVELVVVLCIIKNGPSLLKDLKLRLCDGTSH